MDFGIDTLVYIVIGVIFVLVQATRKRNVAKEKPQAAAQSEKVETKEELSEFWKDFLGVDLTANQDSETIRAQPVPPVFDEPAFFQSEELAVKEPVFQKSSLNDPGNNAENGHIKEARPSDADLAFSPFDLRSAVVYSVILERKYV